MLMAKFLATPTILCFSGSRRLCSVRAS